MWHAGELSFFQQRPESKMVQNQVGPIKQSFEINQSINQSNVHASMHGVIVHICFLFISLRYTEEVFLCRNPFLTATQTKHQDSNTPYLVLGAVCSGCGGNICMDSGCSVYFERRFCLKCATEQPDHCHLPAAVVADCKRRLELAETTTLTDKAT